jgi:hypothetical protein
MASSMHDKMGFKRGLRRREGAEFKRVADAIHRITAARTHDAPDKESPHNVEDDSDSSESGDAPESVAGAELKRVANAIHTITAARTKDASDQTSLTLTNSTSGGPTRHKIEDDYGDSSEGGDNDSTTEVENDDGIFYGNEENYAPRKEESVGADVYIDDIDESEFSEDVEEDFFEDVKEAFREEDESEVSETEAYDETEFKFDEQEEVGVGSVSIDETESEAGLDVLEVVSRERRKW